MRVLFIYIISYRSLQKKIFREVFKKKNKTFVTYPGVGGGFEGKVCLQGVQKLKVYPTAQWDAMYGVNPNALWASEAI